jgi:hypothetical protein
MSNKNIYEVFEDFKKAKTKEDRIAVLQKNDSYALRNVLIGAFHPQVNFTVKKIPEFVRDENMPAGMAYSNMATELKRVYLFMEGNPRVPDGLTEERKTQILIQILESLEPKEADVFAAMLQKKLGVPYLTPILVNEAFEGLLP